MVDRVEAPQPRHRVEQAVDRVLAQVGHEDREEDLHQPRQAARRRQQRRDAEVSGQLRRRQQDQEGRDLDRQVRGQEVHDVQQPLVAEYALLLVGRPQHLDGREDQRHQQHIEQEPVQADRRARVQRLVDRHARAAQQRGGERQRHAGQRQHLLPAQHRGDQAEQDRPEDDRLDQQPHHVHRIERPQLGRGQQLRKVQADDRAQRQNAEEGGQHAAPPAAAEMARIVVAENLVDLVLEHGLSLWRYAFGLEFSERPARERPPWRGVRLSAVRSCA